MPYANHERGLYPKITRGLLCGMISKRDAQDQREVPVKHTCLLGETDRSKINWRLGDQGNMEEGGHGGDSNIHSHKLPVVGYLPSGLITAGCFTFLAIHDSD